MRALYLDVGGDAVLAFLHEPNGEAGPAIILCPPFGPQDAASYRSRRAWAESLAQAGMPVLRFDLQATGDSGGRIDDSGRFESWIEAVGALAAFLRAETGRRTVAIGIGLGGLLAVAAAAEGAPLDELVLWGVPGHGRAIARELTTFARMEADSVVASGAPEPPPGAPHEIGPGGFLVPDTLLAALRRIDLTGLRLPGVERALLLARDGIPPDEGLRTMLEASGADVEIADGDGYGEMMTVLPEAARLPEGVSKRVRTWLNASSHGPRTPTELPSAARCSTSAELAVRDSAITETPLTIGHGGHQLFGILSEPLDAPAGDVALVLLNAGAIRRCGPSRMWVELAREWAARGTPTLRVDLAGIGDGSGTGESLTIADLYSPAYIDEVRAVLDAVTARVGTRRFALLGLCAGAYWGFHTALVDDRVGLVVMLNPRLLRWDPEIVAAYDARNRRSKLLRGSAWRQVRTMRLGSLLSRAIAVTVGLAREPLRAGARRRAQREARIATETALDRLEAAGTRTVFAFCDGEPLREELAAAGLDGQSDRWRNVELVDLPGRDHVFRPLWMHEHLYAAVNRALANELAPRSQAIRAEA